ncbi:MAG TPA: hypothetical protein DEB39_16205, partial [Planctomycetaceae bacterium]|nr:hypothetical protein [Planctomycetaceae bacterium]
RAAQAGEPDPVARWTDLHRSHAATRQRGALDAIRAILPFAPFPTDTTIPSKILSNLPDATAVPGRLILNPLNAPRTAVLDISDFEHLPRENRSIILSRESKRSRDADSSEPPRKEIAVRVPPMGYVLVTDEPDEKEDTPQTRAGDVPEALRPKGLLRTGLMRKVGTMFSGDAASSGKPGPEPPLAYRVSIPLNDGGREVYYVLRNDHFEVRVDALSGAMIALRVHAERGNRLAMQIARRLSKKERDADERSEDDSNYGYSIMSADEIVVESAGPITGRLRISGRLIHPDGRTLARFIQRQTVRRVGRSIEVQLELTPEISEEDAVMKDEPWDSYFAVRWAWGDETHDLYGGVHEGRYPIDPDARCLQLPEFIDLRNETESITLLTNGLPYHRRYGFRRLDTILLSGEELRAGDDTQGAMRTPDEQPDEQPSRTFRFGYAHNAGDPVALSREFALLPEEELVVRTVGSAPPVPMADWLYFIESRNVSCIHWAVLPGTARLRATLLESEGLAANCRFRCRRPILSAIRLNLLGEPGEPLEITEGEIAISMRPHEILPIEFEVACPV